MGGVEGLATFIGIAFLAAGFVKGAIGVGLPTVVMGLLSIVMPPAQAAALMVLPAIGTNIWQMLAGPALGRLARRLAGMIVGVFIGTFATIGLLIAGQLAMGVLIDAAGLFGLERIPLNVARVTGLVLLAGGALLILKR